MDIKGLLQILVRYLELKPDMTTLRSFWKKDKKNAFKQTMIYFVIGAGIWHILNILIAALAMALVFISMGKNIDIYYFLVWGVSWLFLSIRSALMNPVWEWNTQQKKREKQIEEDEREKKETLKKKLAIVNQCCDELCKINMPHSYATSHTHYQHQNIMAFHTYVKLIDNILIDYGIEPVKGMCGDKVVSYCANVRAIISLIELGKVEQAKEINQGFR